jgi:hypothetical protein
MGIQIMTGMVILTFGVTFGVKQQMAIALPKEGLLVLL